MSHEDARNQPGVQPPLPNELREVKYCIPFFFSQEGRNENGIIWSWISKYSHLKAEVSPNLQRGAVHVSVVDALTGVKIKRWSSKVNIIGDAWRYRLSQVVGAAFILAQHRHKCPVCRSETALSLNAADQEQNFRCSAFPGCQGFIRIVDHDVERKEAGSIGIRTIAPAQPASSTGATASS